MDTYSFCSDVGTRLPDRICNLLQLLSHPFRPEAYPSDSREHVQLHPADHSYSNKHNHRYGHRHMAEDTGSIHGICRRGHCEPKPESIKKGAVLLL